MSEGYNDRLSKGIWKGEVGGPEYLASDADIKEACNKLAALIRDSSHFIVHTGAGISTACGIPDFRGPNGIWTCEKEERENPDTGKTLDTAKPSFTHLALKKLMDMDLLKYIITQNVDSLHSKSGVPEDKISELHGCVCLEVCTKCEKRFRRDHDLKQVGLKETGNVCEECGGPLRDQCLDWNQALPEPEYSLAIEHSRKADLSLCLGTSLQIRPAGQLPVRTTRKNGKPKPGHMAIVNLQETPNDSKATVRIFGYCDQVMELVFQELNIEIPEDWPKPVKQSTRDMKPKRKLEGLSKDPSPKRQRTS